MNEVQEFILRRAMQKVASSSYGRRYESPADYYYSQGLLDGGITDDMSRVDQVNVRSKNLYGLLDGSKEVNSYLHPSLGIWARREMDPYRFRKFIDRTSKPEAPEKPITDDTPIAPGITMGMYRTADPETKAQIRKYKQDNNIYEK